MNKVLLLFAFLTFTFLSNTSAQNLNVAIGIKVQSAQRMRRLKTHDRIKVSDKLQLYVKPLQKSYCYLVFNDNQKNATLLNKDNIILNKNHMLILPSSSEYFQFDNKTKVAEFTFICSPNKVKEVENFFAGKSKSSWKLLLNKLKLKYKKLIGSNVEKPINIAGNVRAANVKFEKKLRVFKSDGIIVKDYEVKVKK